MLLLLACSGPGAMRSIARHIDQGYEYALIYLGLLLVSIGFYLLTRTAWLSPVILLALMVLHPAWTVSAYHGDCGTFKVEASVGLIWIAGGGLTLQLIWWLTKPRALPKDVLPGDAA